MAARARRSVRFSDEEWKELTGLACSCGLTVSGFLRFYLFEVPPERRGPDPTSITKWLAADLRGIQQLAEGDVLDEPLSVHITLRFTVREWALVRERSELAGVPPRRFIRFAAVGGQELSERLKSEAVRHLIRVANSLDRLTRYAHVKEQLPARDRLESTLAAVHAAIGSLL